jgi:phosphoadenosine phosphosulfate reductase
VAFDAFETYAGLEGKPLIEALLRDFPGKVVLVSSFGAESAVLLHMAAEVDPDLPVIFLDTGKLFWETRRYRTELVERFGLTNVRTIRPDAGDLARQDPDGTLHSRAPDFCCHIRKTLPLERALSGYDVVISGRKRFHGGERTNIATVGRVDSRLKAEPLAGFSPADLRRYAAEHRLPSHPLAARGYRSIGCLPCTIKGGSDADPRAGRWAGQDKTECGIHWTHNGRPIRVAAGR